MILLVALTTPLGESFGYLDHWPSWSVYSARPDRVQIFIHEDDVPRLPETLNKSLQPPRPLEPWRQLRIDRWSLDAANVPIYPQSRFHLGVALAVAERCHLETMQVVIESSPDRWTGRRRSITWTGLDAVRNHAKTYRLNALPR